MNKEELKKSQPVAWKILSNALKGNQMSHSYLFYGPKGSPKEQMALLVAQSVFCEHKDEDGFACTQCSDCLRIASEDSMDFFWMHPGGIRKGRDLKKKELESYWKQKDQWMDSRKEEYRIRKESILELQEAFSKSSVQGKGQIYILEQYDLATPDASNSLLKFLEEPKEKLTGILIAQQLSNVLPTIVSRCQLIPFRPASYSALRQTIRSVVEDEESADMLAMGGWSVEEVQKLLLEESFFEIKEAADVYYKNKDSHAGIVKMQTEYMIPKKSTVTKNGVYLFLQWVLYYARKDDSLSPSKRLKIMEILLEALDQLRRPVDLALLLDQTYFKIKNVKA